MYSVVNDLQIFMLFLSSLSLALLNNFAWLLALRLVNSCCVLGKRRAFQGVTWRKDSCGGWTAN